MHDRKLDEDGAGPGVDAVPATVAVPARTEAAAGPTHVGAGEAPATVMVSRPAVEDIGAETGDQAVAEKAQDASEQDDRGLAEATTAPDPATEPPPENSPTVEPDTESPHAGARIMPQAPSATTAEPERERDDAARPTSVALDPEPGPGQPARRSANGGAVVQDPAAADAAPEAVPSAAAGALPTMAGRLRAADWRQLLHHAVRWLALALAAWLGLVVALVGVFRLVDPPGSMLMLIQRLGGTTITREWRDLDQISSELARAVVASEDTRFCRHWGIDPTELRDAVMRARDGTPRGASTITMQVAKNLFLWPSKSYVRKALEVPVTLAIEAAWPKRRILEVYLNIVEWGPGVFGAEAAARHHFGKPARRLDAREAALLAVSLPDPIGRRAGKPGRGLQTLARMIERRARGLGRSIDCLGL